MTRLIEDTPLATPAAILLGLESLAERWDPILERAASEGSGEPLPQSNHALIEILLGWVSFRRSLAAQLAVLPDPPRPTTVRATAGWLR
jgi:hypothetical protein